MFDSESKREEERRTLETANQAWQQFYDNQIDFLKEKLQNSIPLDDNLSFEQIIQLIVTQLG